MNRKWWSAGVAEPAGTAGIVVAAAMLLIPLAALAAPMAAARPRAAAQAPAMVPVRFGHVGFAYDPSLATAVSAEVVPEQVAGNEWVSAPEHLRFVFEGAPGANDLPFPAEVRVYPAARYGALNSFAAGTMRVLGELLAARPDLRARYPASLPVGAPSDPAGARQPWELFPPFLPWSGAATIITAHAGYLAGGGVSGIRYVAQQSQNACSTGSRDVTFYTFQGLSADGAWYVAASFPVRVPFEVPPFTPREPGDEVAYAAMCDAANAALAAALEDLPSEAFFPSLDLLDALVTSLRTHLPASAGLPAGAPSAVARRLK